MSSFLQEDTRKSFQIKDLLTTLSKDSLKRRNITPGDKGILWDSYTDTQIFDEWLRLEESNLNWLNELIPCPATVDQCRLDKWHKAKTGVSQKYHPGGHFEVRSHTTLGNHSNQCIYDKDGNLMRNIPAAGTADFRPCPNPPFCLDHYNHDVKPFDLSKKLGRINDYYKVRPSYNEN